jgi:hypothetical protein
MFFLALLLPLPASAQVTLLAHTAAGFSTGSGSSPVTTSAIDTTGASMIAICATGAASNTSAPSDSAANTWLLANTQNEDGDLQVSLWYAIGPTTSATHTFTFKGRAPAGAVMAFSNVASGPDKQSQSMKGGGRLTSGLVSPANDNELVLSCMSFYPSIESPTVSPLTLVDELPYRGGYNGSLGTVSSYMVQTKAMAINPTWVYAHNSAAATVTDTFYSTVSPAPLTVSTTSLPEAFAGTKYSAQLQQSGGIGPFSWALISGTLPAGLNLTAGGAITGTPTTTVSATPLTFKVTDGKSDTASTSGIPLTIASKALTLATNSSCALTGKQYTTYDGCTLVGAGGTPPYTYDWKKVTNSTLSALPEGLSFNVSTGVIGGTVYGQGTYVVQFIATDSLGIAKALNVRFELAGDSTLGGCSLFPSDSIFHRNISMLPVDTSPAAPVSTPYLGARIRHFFGHGPGGLGYTPNGIPFIRVPYDQALVPVTTTKYQHYFTQGPFPSYAPVEATSNSGDQDRHVLVLQTAGGGNPCKLWEMYHGDYQGGSSGAWIDTSNAYWENLSGYAMLPQGKGSTDAAGLPILPLLLNADEVIGTGTPSAPNGSVRHPVRFTVNHMLNAYVWPATQHAGVGGCTGGYEDGNHMLKQSNPPTSCNFSGPAGEIYRLKASVETPACAAHSPQAAIIIEGFRNYGIILADNGLSGGLIGTPDSRWNDADLACLSSLKLGDFEPVNVSGIIVDATSSYKTMGTPASSIAVTPASQH